MEAGGPEACRHVLAKSWPAGLGGWEARERGVLMHKVGFTPASRYENHSGKPESKLATPNVDKTRADSSTYAKR